MRTVYLEPITFECYPEQNTDSTRIPYDDTFFDGKCDEFIRGHRLVPEGCSWERSDGKVFTGKMISLCKPSVEVYAAQAQYERMMAEAEAAYREGVNSVD